MTLDANILIAYLGGEELIIALLSRWRQESVPLILTTVVETEVLSFGGLSPREIEETQAFFEENCISIPFDRRIARIAASIRRSVNIKFPDAAIAATALATNTPLVTRDVRYFWRVPNLRIITL